MVTEVGTADNKCNQQKVEEQWDRPTTNNNEKVENYGIYGATTTVFLAIKLKALIAMSTWCLYALTSAVLAV
jgi:hypothetical protein